MNYEIQQQLIQEMQSKKFYPKDIISDGQIKRFDREGNKNAWYICHLNKTSNGNPFSVLIFGDWKEGNTYKYKTFGNFSEHEKIEINHYFIKKSCDSEILLKLDRENAALAAKKYWNSSAITGEHLYLTDKKIDRLYGTYSYRFKWICFGFTYQKCLR